MGNNAMPGQILANVTQVLQTDPFYYRHFGPYWWRLKKALKAEGYTKANYLGLGEEFPDPEALRRFDDLSDRDFLEKALQEQQENAVERWHSCQQPDPDDEREDYFLHDPDVEA